MLKYRGTLMIFLSILLLVSNIPVGVKAEPTVTTEDIVIVPEPLYHWGFEAEEVDGNAISNQVNKEQSIDNAEMKADASVVEDSEKGNVLHLPGNGWLSLPDNLYENVSDELTVMMWVKVDKNASVYSRLFASTITEKHKYFRGVSGSWADPEFAIAAGGGNYNHLIQKGTNPEGAADYRAAIQWEEQIKRDGWQHVAVSMNSDGSYDVYLDGQGIEIGGMDGNASDPDANLTEAVKQFFDQDYLDALIYNDFGRSIYTSDKDVIGYFDDIQVYNKALTSDQVIAVVGPEYDATLKSITVNDEKIDIENQKNYVYETAEGTVAIEDITIETSNPNAVAGIEKVNQFTYEITVTSPNSKTQITYTLSFYNPKHGAIASFDMTATNGEIMHGASGFLYGVSEPNVPTIDLLEPLKPQHTEQKPPNGLQHPSGDGLRVADTFFEAGGEMMQLAVQDMYLQWPYEYEGLDHYEQFVRETVRAVKDTKYSDKIVYVLFNEPDGIWFGGNLDEDGFFNAWERMYKVVKEEDPDAKVAGPNLSRYSYDVHENFVKFVVEHDVIPDQFTWHELSGENSLSNWEDHINHYRSLEEQYGIERRPIVINEYSNPEDPGAPGSMIQWLSRIELSKVYGGIAYWHAANSLNELAADMNKPNGTWWLYKWYGDMTGQTVDIETYNTQADGMYGLASIDKDKGKAYTIFGGEDGVITATMKDLSDTKTFKNAESVHVKLYRTKYTGFMGSHEEPRVEFEGNVPLVDGNLHITVNDAARLDGYHAIVTPATDDTITDPQDYKRIWTKTYEAENAELNGAYIEAQGWGVTSNKAYIRGLNSPEKNVRINVEVPTDGKYKLEVLYGNGAPLTDGKNRAQGKLAKQLLKLDGKKYEVLTYNSTVDINNFASEKLYLDLSEGTHTLEFSMESGMEASLDKIDLTYVGEKGQEITKTYQFEAEEAGYDDGFNLAQKNDSFSGAGYIKGSGENQYTVVVEDNGYYDLELGYASNSDQTINFQKRIVNYAADAKFDSELSTEWSQIASYNVEKSKDITSISGTKVYLTAGANAIKVTSEKAISLDFLKVIYLPDETESETIQVEAEDGKLFGEARIMQNVNTSGEKIVGDIGKSKENGLSFTVNVEEAGAYKLSIDYINNEPAPVMYTPDQPNGYLHPYNTDLVERYAQVEVNDQTPQTVYFRNTLSWDTVKNHVIDINLEAGENTITLYNDNSYRYNDVIQYAPDFDKFEIAKATLSSGNSGSNVKN